MTGRAAWSWAGMFAVGWALAFVGEKQAAITCLVGATVIGALAPERPKR